MTFLRDILLLKALRRQFHALTNLGAWKEKNNMYENHFAANYYPKKTRRNAVKPNAKLISYRLVNLLISQMQGHRIFLLAMFKKKQGN